SVKDNIRLAAGQATISGSVGGNVTALSGTVEVQPSAMIGGSFVGLAGNIDVAGPVHGQVYVGTSNLRLSNGVQGDVTAYVNHLRVTSKAQIEGQLEYWSNTKASIDSGAQIIGPTVHHPSFFYSIAEGKVVKSLRLGTKLLPLVMNFLYTLALGIILMRYFPKSIEQGLKAIKKNLVHTVLTGVVILVLLPLVSLLFLMSVLGAPFAITLIAVNVFAFYTAKIFTIIWAQTLVFSKRFEKHKKLYFALGLIVYFVLTMIPHVGDIIAFAAMLIGLGAMTRGRVIAMEKA
ncbi:MAG TPA: polymer-forming cytoskeletal protein, partial [Chlamydiales bacterium]|nr:polymer-forming cytoskeletal protein [Chlamydiales bacterium]